MEEIEKIRLEIDEIHDDMARLFRQRLLLAEKIWEIKKTRNISMLDSDREQKIIQKYDDSISGERERQAVQNLFKNVLFETKKYLEERFK